MKNTKEIREILTTAKVIEKFFDFWIESTNDGIMIYSKTEGAIIYLNESARQLLGITVDSEKRQISLMELFNESEQEAILSFTDTNYLDLESKRKFYILCEKKYILVVFSDFSQKMESTNNTQEIKQLNKELQMIYTHYADDTIFVTDGTGTVLYAGPELSQNCGVIAGYFEGKNVYELEKMRFFYPSAAVRVLETKQPQVVIQKTKIGETYVATGQPVLDENGKISKIIVICKDFNQSIALGTLLSNQSSEKRAVIDNDGIHNEIITCNNEMFKCIAMVKLVSKVDTTVLITGETGTGKEVIARMIHRLSNRADMPFIKVNCGAITDTLIESEIFGYEAGAFTGASKTGKTGLIELADGGTLFLDEIGELPLGQQVKILHVLQEKVITKVGGIKQIQLDVRIIAATNRNLDKMVEEGLFREDLFYRLSVVPILIPALRRRVEDIPLLTKFFLKQFNKVYKKRIDIPKEIVDIFMKYSWPGNVRELENTMERLVVVTQDHTIECNNLPNKIKKYYLENLTAEIDYAVQVNTIIPLKNAVEQLEKKLVEMAFEKVGNAKKVAELLEVNQSTVSRKMVQYKICGK